MTGVSAGDVQRQLRHLFEAGSAIGLADGQLLDRFVSAGRHGQNESAESAFETILSRHGSTVLTVCRQVLGDAHAAEDAFQTTFLVLVRRAGSLRIREHGSLGPWLYGVAYRTALKARQGGFRRQAREHRVAVPQARVGQGAATVEHDDFGAALHEEVNRLPAKYRRRWSFATSKAKHTTRRPHRFGGRWERSAVTFLVPVNCCGAASPAAAWHRPGHSNLRCDCPKCEPTCRCRCEWQRSPP